MTLRIIYYLSREGQLEEPHLLEVPAAASNSRVLHLTDVKKWLSLTRGKSMPASFSWSYRRNYKEGCIWQDVSADDDLILPASEGEYVLKGSKLVVASKELWPASVFAKLDQASPGIHNELDCTVRVKEDIRRANGGGTVGLSAGNERDADVSEGLCQVACSGAVGKFDDQDRNLADTSSPCVRGNNQRPPNSNLQILELPQGLVHICHNAKEQETTKSFCDPGNTAMASRHVSCPTASAGSRLEAKQVKRATTAGDQMDRQSSDLNLAENAGFLQTSDNHIKHQTNGSDQRDRQVSDLKVAKHANLLQTSHKHRVCGAPCDASDSVDVALMSRNCSRAPSKTLDMRMNGYNTLVGSRALTCPLVGNSLHDKSPKVIDVNLTESEDKPSKLPSKVVAKRRRNRTNWGCRYTPVSLSHLRANSVEDMSACKPCLPSTNEHILQRIGGRIPLPGKKLSNKRVSYSDKLGVKLPATIMKDVIVDDSEPLCPFHQRLATKWAPLSSSHTPTPGHKTATSQCLQKKTSLPVFGSEKRQQQLIEELDLCSIESGTSDISFMRKSKELQFSCMQQACKLPLHEHRCPENAVVHNHNHPIFSRSASRKGTKILWEELLQTTQDALTRQETI